MRPALLKMVFLKCIFAWFLLINKGTNAWLFGKPDETTKPEWDKLTATFLKYRNLPMTADDAEKDGWTNTAACQDDAYFRGNRYILNNDPALMLLFDSRGKIAGIQNGVLKSKASHNFFKQPSWIEDGNMLVVTAYFVDPDVICNGKREQSEYLGDSLFIQTGPTPGSLMSIPLKQEDAEKTKWVKGKCVWGMGQHFWYNISNNMNCDDFFPSFVLYNKGKLNAFGWVAVGDFESNRYEHPPTSVLDYFFQPESQPICVKQLSKLSTIHVYFDVRPYFNLC